MKFRGHLHVHTEYSMLDGMAKIEDLIVKAKSLGQDSMCITDHGSSSGLYEAWTLSKKYDFNICYGEEFYIEAPSEDTKTGHIILIAKDNQGLADIFKLQQLAYDNMYYKPRITLDMLQDYNKHLVCTTACIANPINQYLLKGEKELAVEYFQNLIDIFGDDLYVELQSGNNPDVRRVNQQLVTINKSQKYIITSDVHYLNEEDWAVHEVELCIAQKTKMDSKKRLGFEYNDYWLKSEHEMTYNSNLDDKLIECCYEGIDEVFNKCSDVNFVIQDHLPKYYPTKAQETKELFRMVEDGIENKLKPRDEYNADFSKDLEKELKVIDETGYSGYFLTVQEYANWARNNNIQVGDGRGSGAGSKVAYTIGITDVNPQKYGLLFERFLTPGRQPDFDIDFSDIDAVFRHLQDRYGRTNVARVGAFTTFTAKSATQKVMSAYGFEYKESRKILDLMPDELSFTLEDALNNSSDLENWFSKHPDVYKAVSKLEGHIEHMSTHAGGVVICNNLTSLLPTMVRADDKDKLIIALDKHDIEALGHYKFDVLGLSGLEVMKDIEDYVHINWHNVDFEDENVYKMLQEGNVMGVFQLSNQKDKVMQQQPKCFEDLISINALIRPGVCDWKEYLTARMNPPKDEDILPFMRSTHNLIVYQDQYLQLAEYYAGWNIAYGDKHIRKNKNILNDVDLKNKWIKDTTNRGYDEKTMINLWDTITHIVSHGYGFNRAHSTSYAILSFKTAYCKYYHPKEFYAAYLTKSMSKPDKLKALIPVVKEAGIKLIRPDINKSEDKFIPTEDGILMPLTSIKGIGGSAVYAIKNIRPIVSFEDFMKRRIKKFIRKTAISALIKAGAFDFEGKTRDELINIYSPEEKKTKIEEYDFEAFGFYIDRTPFDNYKLKDFNDIGQNRSFISIMQIEEIKVRKDRRKHDMAFMVLSNNINTIEAVVFASVWSDSIVSEEDVVFVSGKKDKDKLLVDKIEVI